MTPAALARHGEAWHAAKAEERRTMAALRKAIVKAVDGGMSEVDAAKVARVDRGTVRLALGKPRA